MEIIIIIQNINLIKCKREERERGLLQVEVIYEAEIVMSTAKYLNRKYKEDQLVKSHENNQPNMNSTVKA
jgi:orotate phosphoribosyltransferase-like protein